MICWWGGHGTGINNAARFGCPKRRLSGGASAPGRCRGVMGHPGVGSSRASRNQSSISGKPGGIWGRRHPEQPLPCEKLCWPCSGDPYFITSPLLSQSIRRMSNKKGTNPSAPHRAMGARSPPNPGHPPGARVGARLRPWPRGAGCGDLQPGRALGTAARAVQEFRAPEVIGEGGRGADGATSLPLRAAPAAGGASTGTRAGRGTMLLLISDND